MTDDTRPESVEASVPEPSGTEEPVAIAPDDLPEELDPEAAAEQAAWLEGYEPWPGRLAFASSYSGPLPGLEYATVGARIVGFLVDVLFLGFVVTTLGALVLNPLFHTLADAAGTNPTARDITAAGVKFLAIDLVGFSVIGAAIWVYFLKALRATPGQYVVRLRTVDVANGRPVSVAAAVIRWLVVLLPIMALPQIVSLSSVWDQDNIGQITPISYAVIAAWYLLLVILMIAEPRRRGLQDRLTGSVVVEPD